jgi:hypothetical protein
MLLTYSYPDGSPTATVVGLAVLALTLLVYWISLRLLFRAGLPPARSLRAVTLAALVGGCATLTEIARRKPQGFDPGGEAGFSGVSTACAASEKNGAVEVMDGDRAQDVPGETEAHAGSGAGA